ncbi:lipoprotein [Aliivibrio sp. S10_S31]|uniref:lipoprotein n=1 Tax=Aliivibrio sp. S10_S31 TaxID=2720224 RepID=UPI001680E34A|nr:lipoprotein [Aliivibrio sp. S10_S31]MBD1569743.1 lipoprotein [Aliivibrio sp. S10_S31]
MKKYIVPALLVIGLTGCNSEDMFTSSTVDPINPIIPSEPVILRVSMSQDEPNDNGVLVNDNVTAEAEVIGGNSNEVISYSWKINESEIVGETDQTYTVKNADWPKILTVCASVGGNDEVCTEEGEGLRVLPRYPASATGPVQFAY